MTPPQHAANGPAPSLYWSRIVHDTIAPCPAWTAAVELAAEGHHVHYWADGESRCITGECAPACP
ncbi:hypothetical protein [Streptomyces sp. NPDC046978]|uniref:hypothetical protein n=1 Tax=Streptomyces sp. NPDC046978 TaxID=3154704 RepID=UPI0034061C96